MPLFSTRAALDDAPLVKMEPVAGFLSVAADGGPARVLVDGKPIGLTPVTEWVATPGPHQVSVRQDGYQTEERAVSIRLGREQVVSVKLVPLPEVAQRPERTKLTPTLELHPATAVPAATLASSPPLYQRWYVWAGAAAVVAVVAVGVASSASHAAAVRPFNATTEVCRGPCDQCIGPACSAAR